MVIRMDPNTSKNLGGIGALLVAIGALPLIGVYSTLLILIGLVLFLIGMKGLAEYFSESRIFNRALWGILMPLVGVVVAIGILFTVALSALVALGLSGIDWTNYRAFEEAFSSIDWGAASNINIIMSFAGSALIAIVILVAAFIIGYYFLKSSFNTLAQKTGKGLFSTAGLLFFIGAILTFVAVGLILIWVGWVVATIAFLQLDLKAMPPDATPKAVAPPPPPKAPI